MYSNKKYNNWSLTLVCILFIHTTFAFAFLFYDDSMQFFADAYGNGRKGVSGPDKL